jgi:hypothetical protein
MKGIAVKILHLVTLISTDGAFGGPTRVALNQAAELRRRDQDVQVAAGSRRDKSPPQSISGVPLHLFPIIQLNDEIAVDDGAWIACPSTVLRGVKVGRGATVGSGTVVSRSIEPGLVVFAPTAVKR